MNNHCNNLADDVPECLKRGHKRIKPGVYKCSEGHQHINGPEVLQGLGLEPTEENLERLLEYARHRFTNLKVIP